MPLGIIITENQIVTVSLNENYVINDFIERKNKTFYTYKKTRFLLQILYKTSKLYLQYLRHIDKTSDKIECKLHKSLKNQELIQLLELEKSLVYFSTSLKSMRLYSKRFKGLTLLRCIPKTRSFLKMSL
jgi:magnesium transporter